MEESLLEIRRILEADHLSSEARIEHGLDAVERALKDVTKRETRACHDIAWQVTGDPEYDRKTAEIIAGRLSMRGINETGQYVVERLPQNDGMKILRSIFEGGVEGGVDHTMNWLFLSTSGVHGCYTNLDDICKSAQRLRVVCSSCLSIPDGDFPVGNPGDKCLLGSCTGILHRVNKCWDPRHDILCQCGAEFDPSNPTLVHPDGGFTITALVVKPRIVQVVYGTIQAHVSDIRFLRDTVYKSLQGIHASQSGNAPAPGSMHPSASIVLSLLRDAEESIGAISKIAKILPHRDLEEALSDWEMADSPILIPPPDSGLR